MARYAHKRTSTLSFAGHSSLLWPPKGFVCVKNCNGGKEGFFSAQYKALADSLFADHQLTTLLRF